MAPPGEGPWRVLVSLDLFVAMVQQCLNRWYATETSDLVHWSSLARMERVREIVSGLCRCLTSWKHHVEHSNVRKCSCNSTRREYLGEHDNCVPEVFKKARTYLCRSHQVASRNWVSLDEWNSLRYRDHQTKEGERQNRVRFSRRVSSLFSHSVLP